VERGASRQYAGSIRSSVRLPYGPDWFIVIEPLFRSLGSLGANPRLWALSGAPTSVSVGYAIDMIDPRRVAVEHGDNSLRGHNTGGGRLYDRLFFSG